MFRRTQKVFKRYLKPHGSETVRITTYYVLWKIPVYVYEEILSSTQTGL